MELKRIEKHIIRKGHPLFKEVDHVCFLSKNLYNYVNYCIRQSYFHTKKIMGEYELDSKLTKRNQRDFRALPNNVSQQIIRVIFQNWKFYFRAIKDFNKNKSKYTSEPKIPRYKEKNGRNIVIFNYRTSRIKEGYIHFAKNIISPLKTKVENSNLVQVQVVPCNSYYTINIIYKKEVNSTYNLTEKNKLSIDLGVNNLATCFANNGERPFIINGKPVKAINYYYNKKLSKLRSFVGNGTSNKIKKLCLKRKNKIDNYFHHSSKAIVSYCIHHQIGVVIIGHNKYWKSSSMGKRNNQNFHYIPFNDFINQLVYKCEEKGIKVIITEEKYTSKIDHLAMESMEHHDNYMGRRVHRGLFKSSTSTLLNADVNGAIGILRKVDGDSSIKEILVKGQAMCPFRMNIFDRLNKTS